MARPLRIEFAGALYHITSQGNARENIYQNDTDRKIFLDLLESACDRYGWRVSHVLFDVEPLSLADRDS